MEIIVLRNGELIKTNTIEKGDEFFSHYNSVDEIEIAELTKVTEVMETTETPILKSKRKKKDDTITNI